MIFTAFGFWGFFAVTFTAVILNSLLFKSVRLQTLLLLGASYFFYAQWDWRFLILILISTCTDYICGGRIPFSKTPRAWLSVSIAINLGILGFFKYFNFFVSEAASLLREIGFTASGSTLSIILPVGISFYTFQSLSYTIDIYKKRLKPAVDPVAFATFVAFFPQLVAGPIERATHLLPQFNKLWRFDEKKFVQGLRLILFGLFLKIVIADNLSPWVDRIFAMDPGRLNGGTLALGILYFAFQIYGDFCGYSTIAIGIAVILGFELTTNFRTPYFSASISDFWQRWHISLSAFFRDYVYFPLGGSRENVFKTTRNLVGTFLLSGLWHGASWTFIVWGAYHGILLAIENILTRRLPVFLSARALVPLKVLFTFSLVCLGWVFFRSPTLEGALNIFVEMLSNPGLPDRFLPGLFFVLLAIAVDWLWRKDTRLEVLCSPFRLRGGINFPRWSVYTALFWLVLLYWAKNEGNEFIYFQF